MLIDIRINTALIMLNDIKSYINAKALKINSFLARKAAKKLESYNFILRRMNEL